MPVILPDGRVVSDDGRVVSGNPRNGQPIFPGFPGEPGPNLPPPQQLPDQPPPGQGQQPPQQNQKPPPDQFAGPVEEGFSGQAQPPTDPRFITEPTQPGNNLFNFGPSEEVGPSSGSLINDQITNTLLNQDPFPSQLVPPFRVRPGLNGGTTADSILGGGPGSGAGFQQAQGSTARAGRASVNLDRFNATTREVQDEELTSNQLNSLLEEDGAFIQNALQRGRELAQDRGALSSSIFAGASQRAAIDAALPIASADAQAFQRAASENMAALNQNTLAKLQSATQIAISNASNQTQASVATAQNRTQASTANAQISGRLGEARLRFESQRIANDARERIAETQLNAQFTMQQGQFAQQRFMEQLQQQGRIDITQLGGQIQAELQSRGFQQEIDLRNLNQANLIEIQELFEQPRFEETMAFNRAQSQARLGINVMGMGAQMLRDMEGLDIDPAAVERKFGQINSFLRLGFQLTQGISNPDLWDDINIGNLFSGPGG